MSGTIQLETAINLGSEHGDLTIAGQTAPGDGICVKGHQIYFTGTDNIIVRYLRFRHGWDTGDEDSFGGNDANRVIVDHCSVSWAVDENLSIYGGDDLTIQYCLISEALDYRNGSSAASKGGMQSAANASIHHNLFAHNAKRNPLVAPFDIGTHENVDVRNNVIYNWGFHETNVSGQATFAQGNPDLSLSIVNNYYKGGPATVYPSWFAAVAFTPTVPWYVEGNYIHGDPEITADNWATGYRRGIYPTIPPRASSPHEVSPITTQSAEDVLDIVLADVGARLPARDPVDERIVSEVRSGTATYGGNYGAGLGLIDDEATVGGWPVLESAPAPPDADHDGMPDDWETSHGLDPNDPTDGADIAPSGYSHLEEYLNSLVYTPCQADTDCATGFCTDGVCCDSRCGDGTADDCQACSVEAGAEQNGVCGPVRQSAQHRCRAAAEECQLPAVCDGQSSTCPDNPAADDGTACGERGTCQSGACIESDGGLPDPTTPAGGDQPSDGCSCMLVGGGGSRPDRSAALGWLLALSCFAAGTRRSRLVPR
ncbi:MAG: hypothetical protein JRI23_22205 [Deltaproteobacteria bacterium]|nr:hypothetical protein [Deltaproteobacteria bacterium]